MGRTSPGRYARMALAAVAVFVTAVCASRTPMLAQIELAPSLQSVSISADWMQEWQRGDEHIAIFRGRCEVTHGKRTFTANKMVIWVVPNPDPVGPESVAAGDRLTIYLEDNVVETSPTGTASHTQHVVEIDSAEGANLAVRGRSAHEPGDQDPLYIRAFDRKQVVARSWLKQTQLTVETNPAAVSTVGVPVAQNTAPPPLGNRSGILGNSPLGGPATAGDLRRVRIYPRSSAPYNIQSFRSDNTTPPEQVVLITGGVSLIVEGLTIDRMPTAVGPVDLSADRAVIWTDAMQGDDFSTDSLQAENSRFQVYLEGNLVVRQGASVIRAERAFYDTRDNRALIENAELRTSVPELGITVRVRAERIRQLARESFQAQNAFVTTSTYGRPGYRVQAQEIRVEPHQGSFFGFTPPAQVDPATGQLVAPPARPWVTSLNNTIFVEDVPIGFVPYLSAPADDPHLPIESISYRQDRIFGSQIRTSWDMFAVLGLERPAGTEWHSQLNYLSKRGVQLGTLARHEGEDWFGNRWFSRGLKSAVYDHGSDNLGFDRRSLAPPDTLRGMLDIEHKHFLPAGLQLWTSLGWASDRNFREQYFENDFDRKRDLETLGYLNQKSENMAWTALLRPTLNRFENNTGWLPKADFYALSHPLFGGLLSYSNHSYAGYAQLHQANPPTNPQDLFSPLPYYIDGSGAVGSTRHEIEAPFNFGGVNFAPYALGEATYWGDSLTGSSLGRLYGRAGLRASVQFWKVYPYLQSEIFNLNGLAHRMILSANYGYGSSSQPLAKVAQWNEFDDDAQERFRERLLVNTFGGTLPPQFDPRGYAVRSGAATSVTAPYNELVDSQEMLSLNWAHRLQTKVGPPDRLRIKDWMTLNMGVNYYPNKDRDNFGQSFGLYNAQYAWFFGDRTSLHASTLFDTFTNGQNDWSVGLLSQRSVRGSVYVGLRNIYGGPSLQSQILTLSSSYVMSPKWVSTVGTAYDLGEQTNRGQSFTLTRVGESFLVHLGLNYDASKNNAGLGISIEPRIGNSRITQTKLGSLTGTGF